MSHAYRNGNYYSEVAKRYEPASIIVASVAFLCGFGILAYDFHLLRRVKRWLCSKDEGGKTEEAKNNDAKERKEEKVTATLTIWLVIVLSEMCISGSMLNGFPGSNLCRTQGGFFMFFSRFSWMYSAIQGFSMVHQYYNNFLGIFPFSKINPGTGDRWISFITGKVECLFFFCFTVVNFTLEMVPFMSTKVHAEYGVDDQIEYETACSMDFSIRWKRWVALFYVGPLMGCLCFTILCWIQYAKESQLVRGVLSNCCQCVNPPLNPDAENVGYFFGWCLILKVLVYAPFGIYMCIYIALPDTNQSLEVYGIYVICRVVSCTFLILVAIAYIIIALLGLNAHIEDVKKTPLTDNLAADAVSPPLEMSPPTSPTGNNEA